MGRQPRPDFRPVHIRLQKFVDAGYLERQVLDIVLALAVKTLSNYSNHLFGTQLDERFAAYEWAPIAA